MSSVGNDGEGSVEVVGDVGGGDATTRHSKCVPHSTVIRKGRVRVSQPNTWAKNVAKTKCNLHESYVGYMEARKVGPPSHDHCFEKLGREAIDKMCDNFWAIGDLATLVTDINRLFRGPISLCFLGV